MRFIDDGRMTPFNTGSTNSVPNLNSISDIFQRNREGFTPVAYSTRESRGERQVVVDGELSF